MKQNDKTSDSPQEAAQQILAAIRAACEPEIAALEAARAAWAEFEGVSGVTTERVSGLRAKIKNLKAKISAAVAGNQDPLPATRELRATQSDLADLEEFVPQVHEERLRELKQAVTQAEEDLFKAATRALQNSPTHAAYEEMFNDHLAAAVALQDGFREGLSLAGIELGFKHHSLSYQHPINKLRCTNRAVGRALPDIPSLR